MSFKALIDACNAELDVAEAGSEVLTKALSAKDDKDEQIKDMAAKDDDEATDAEDAEDDDSDEDEPEDEDEDGTEADVKDDETLGKSLTLTGPDNEPVEVYDGTELVKSLVASQERIARHLNVALSAATVLTHKLGAQEAHAVEQDVLIKSLQSQLAQLGREGRGRKSVLNVHEKQHGTDVSQKPTPDVYLSKARTLLGQGRLDSLQVARAEAYLGRGMPLPPDLENLLGNQ